MAGRPLATLRRPKLTPVFLSLDACSHAVRSLASVARLSGPVRDAVAARPSVRPSVCPSLWKSLCPDGRPGRLAVYGTAGGCGGSVETQMR